MLQGPLQLQNLGVCDTGAAQREDGVAAAVDVRHVDNNGADAVGPGICFVVQAPWHKVATKGLVCHGRHARNRHHILVRVDRDTYDVGVESVTAGGWTINVRRRGWGKNQGVHRPVTEAMRSSMRRMTESFRTNVSQLRREWG